MCLGIPGKITEITNDDPVFRAGKVEFGKIQKEISLAYTPEAEVGDYVIVHAGFAISSIDEEEAQKTFELIAELEEHELEALKESP